jgi:DNA-binding GntR family transcriptional regulator
LRRFLVLKRQRLYGTLEEAVQLHEPILEAIVAGDVDRAEAAARHHVFEAAHLLGSRQISTARDSEAEEVTA